jgi:hypothetical protein
LCVFVSQSRSEGKSEIAQYPEDFTLFELGTFHEDSGQIIMHESKISLCNGKEYAQSK